MSQLRKRPVWESRKQIKTLAARAAASAAALAGMMGGLNLVQGQAVTWASALDGSWSQASNWLGGVVPAGGSTSTLTFNTLLGNSYLATNDLGSPFVLNSLILNTATIGNISLESAPSNALHFSGTAPSITTGYGGKSSISSPISIDAASGSLSIGGGGFLALSGPISGNAALNITNGTTSLSGNNTYTGGTTLTAGELHFGSDANLGDAAGTLTLAASGNNDDALSLTGDWTTSRPIVANARDTLLFDNGHSTVFNGTLSGSGQLSKSGEGKMTITGNASAFTGTLTSSGSGAVQVDTTIPAGSSNWNISNLTGSGTILRRVSVGTLSPGNNSAATLHFATLSMGASAKIVMDVGTNTDHIIVDGALSAGGTMFLGDTTGLTAGTYPLFTYASHTGGSVPVITSSSTFAASMTFGSTIGTLTVTNETQNEWAPGGLGTDGSGTWSSGGSGWQLNGVTSTYTSGNANFGHGGAAGIVTVNGLVPAHWVVLNPVSSGAYQFQPGGSGGTISLTRGIEALTADAVFNCQVNLSGTGFNVVNVGAGHTVSMTSNVNGPISTIKNGAGTWTISGAGGSTAAITLNEGTVKLDTGGTWAGSLTINAGGTFRVANGAAVTNFVSLKGNGGNLQIDAGSNFTLLDQFAPTINPVISGDGSFSYAPAAYSSLQLTAPSSYTGGTTFNANSEVILNDIHALGTGSVVFNKTNLPNRDLILFDTTGGTETFANDLRLPLTSGVTSQISNTIDYQYTTISGLLSGGNANGTIGFGDVSGDSASELILTNSGNSFVGKVVIGGEMVGVTSNGALGNSANTLKINPSFTGGLRFEADGITIPRALVLAGPHPVIDSSINSGTMSGVISGTSGFEKYGSGVLTTTAPNTYSGQTIVEQGELRILGTNTGAGSYTVHAGTLTFGANESISSLSISAGANAVLNSGSKITLKTSTISLAGGFAAPTATLDLDRNDMIVTGGTYADIASAIRYARNGGAWNQPGLTSTAARTASPITDKTLGTMTGLDLHSIIGNSGTFNGQMFANSDVLVKFTYYGDANFNGKVDGGDYARIDTSFGSQGTMGNIGGWVNGDFNYNEKIDGGDYALIDLAFSSQQGVIARAMQYLNGDDLSGDDMNDPALQMIVLHYGEFGQPYASIILNSVPEPACVSLLGLFGALLVRRRRH